ncbi:MAG: nucleotide-binding protein [Bifidobacteriaceae bacterium]|nr:nucleotide-binding protein [Bifidobacteriaceae bacterium]
MKDAYERVFIAWGGNQRLAGAVAARLAESHFAAVVGGGTPTDRFVGTQVLSQIHSCTRAILLVEDTGAAQTAAGLNFSDNLMFEWGFITGTFQPNKVHVFLINVSTRDLPSDLAGSWAVEIESQGRELEDVAQRITEAFFKDATHNIELDKMKIMHMWDSVKRYADVYDDGPPCSDLELAHYLLHSIESCYYHMEEDLYEALLDKMHPVSSVLEFAVQIVKANIRLFRETGGLQRALQLDSFAELRAVFERQFDLSFQDEELNLWFSYFAVRRQGLLYQTVSLSQEFDDAEQREFAGRTLVLTSQAITVLDQIVERYPQQAAYTNLYRGYLLRTRSQMFSRLGRIEEAAEANLAATRAKEAFYLDYKNAYPHDTYLIRQLAQEYYLALAERLGYASDPTDKAMIRRTIASFLAKLEQESGRQHVVLEELRTVFAQSTAPEA